MELLLPSEVSIVPRLRDYPLLYSRPYIAARTYIGEKHFALSWKSICPIAKDDMSRHEGVSITS